MKRLDPLKYFASAVVCAALLCSCASTPGRQEDTTPDGTGQLGGDSSVTLPDIAQVSEAVVGEDVTVSTDGSITLGQSAATVSGDGLSASGTTVTVLAAGTYTVTGECDAGQIIVDTEDTEKVKLIFNGVRLTCPDSAAIYVVNAPKKVIIYTQKGSVNIVSDGATRPEAESEDADIPTAAIYSRDDLKLDGEGELYVTGNYGKGILTKDDLEICGGSIYVTSVDDGVRGKDSVEMSGGYVVINAGADGLRSNNDSDADRGYISITGGELYISAAQDGVQAETALTISGGIINVVSGGGVSASQGNMTNGMGGDIPSMPDGMGGDAPSMPDGMGGDIPSMPDGMGGDAPSMPDGMGGDAPSMPSAGDSGRGRGNGGGGFGGFGGFGGGRPGDDRPGSNGTSSEDTVSTKGLKAGTTLTIDGGVITVNSVDDSIHSNGNVNIGGGELSLSSGDDGIHADETLTVSSGSITVLRSYEGLEALTLEISGGVIDVTASDDGLNAAGGTSGGGFMRPGSGSASDSNGLINITGGKITVNASGDGVDSNGNIRMSGGELIVYGPTDNGNGALDFDGSFNMSGGTLLAVGSLGMAQKPTGTGNVRVLSVNKTVNAGGTVTVTDSSGATIANFTLPKRASSIIYASDGLDSGAKIVVG